MADRVIIVGASRRNEKIPIGEIFQMCVSEKQRILVSGHSEVYKLAKDVQVGDGIASVDGDGKVVDDVVANKFIRQGECSRFRFSNGTEICVGNHPIKMWDGSWKSSDNLEIGDKVSIVCKTALSDRMDYTNKLKSTLSAKRDCQPLFGDCFYTRLLEKEKLGIIPLVNFTVKKCGTFICEDIVTHNCGRAGRGHEGGDCSADIIVEDSDADYVTEGLESKANLVVNSVLSKKKILEFHVLPEICSGVIENEETAKAWHSRSFHSFCGEEVDWISVFNSLRDDEAINCSGGVVSSTVLGDIASAYYFHPSDVRDWKDNFSLVFEMGIENDDVAIAWALGNVEGGRRSGSFGNNWEVLDDCQNRLPPGLEMKKGCSITTTLWWHVFGGPSVGKLRNQSLELKEDFGRIHRVLLALDEGLTEWGMSDFIESLYSRSRRAIPSELVDLMNIPNMTKGKAVALKEMGIENQKEFNRAKKNIDLSEVLGEGYEF